MAIRQQHVVFLLAALVVGWGVYGSLGGGSRRGPSRSSGSSPEFVDHRAPDVDLARPRTRDDDALLREFFSEPSDTRPLPPLEFELPPLAQLPSLRPPAGPGPRADLFGDLLRTDREPEPVLDLFEDLGPADDQGATEEALEDAGSVDWNLLSPEEKSERRASYRRQYDWILTNEIKYGRILNRDRFRLRQPLERNLLFLELDPETGQERFPGADPIEYGPTAAVPVEDFGLAETVINALELERADFPDELTKGSYPSVMAFADRAFLAREAGPRALEIAEEFYRRAVPLTSEPDPRLGLARCYEAEFRFEDAFDIYHALMDDGFSENPVVLARLGRLEARFRLYDRAEQHLDLAARFGPNEWEVQHVRGNLLLERGRSTEALQALEIASKNEPQAAEHQPVRAMLRSRLGDALVAEGRLDQARRAYDRALLADPGHQSALAGLASVAYLEGAASEGGAASDAGLEGAGIDAPEAELLLAEGLLRMGREDWVGAAEQLNLAAEADPLSAYRAWRALSWLAEATGHPEEALRYAEQAYMLDPSDTYTLVQRGRVLAERDDVEGAIDSFTAALDQELDLPDALAALGRLSFFDGEHADAEMYFERSVSIDDSQAQVHALRGVNRLMQGDEVAARESFQRARAIERDLGVARAGLAWCAYLDGEAVEAITLYRELDDSLRSRPDDDPLRLYARRQIERIDDHVEKVVWTDRFERQHIRNGWQIEEGAGPLVTIHDGAVRIEGTFADTGRSRLKREYPAGDFLMIEVELTVLRDNRSRVGAFVSLEQSRRGENEIQAEATISRNLDGALQTRVQRRGGEDAPYVDVPVIDWNVGDRMVLRIERTGESSDTEVRLSIGEKGSETGPIAVADRIPMPGLGRTTSKLWVGVFAEGDPGRVVKARIDRVEVVKRQR